MLSGTTNANIEIPQGFKIRSGAEYTASNYQIIWGHTTVKWLVGDLYKRLNGIVEPQSSFDANTHIFVLKSKTGASVLLNPNSDADLAAYVKNLTEYNEGCTLKVISKRQQVEFIDRASGEVHSIDIDLGEAGMTYYISIKRAFSKKVKSFCVIGKEESDFITYEDIINREGRELGLVTFSNSLKINCQGNLYDVEFQPSDKIKDVKGKLAALMPSVPIENMVLACKGMWLGSEDKVSPELIQTQKDLGNNVKGASGIFDQQLRHLPVQNDNLTMEECEIKDGAKLQLYIRPQNKEFYKAPEGNAKTGNQALLPIYSFCSAFITQMMLLYGTAYMRPDTVMPLKVSIPLSLLMGTVVGVVVHAYQGQERA